jgi:hypothetical protein
LLENSRSDESSIDLFAGFPVSDYASALTWYEQLLGGPPAFLPNDIEAVWELASHRYLFIKVLPEHAGHAFNLTFLGDLDGFTTRAARRGLEPASRETLVNGVRRVIYNDPDGNDVGFGGLSSFASSASSSKAELWRKESGQGASPDWATSGSRSP